MVFLSGKNLIGSAYPGTLAEYFFNIFGENYLTGNEGLGEAMMTFGILRENILGTFILLVDYAGHFAVYHLSALVGIWFGEAVILTGGVVVAEIGKLLAHAIIYHHGIGLFRDTLEVVGRSGGDMTKEQLL